MIRVFAPCGRNVMMASAPMFRVTVFRRRYLRSPKSLLGAGYLKTSGISKGPSSTLITWRGSKHNTSSRPRSCWSK